MQTAFRIAYSAVVAILMILVVILGIRTFYAEPEAPSFPAGPRIARPPVGGTEPLFCNPDGRCYKGPHEISADDSSLTDEERAYIREQQDFYEKQAAYEDERVDYHRNVFIITQALGILAVGAGVYLFRRVEALPLGLLLGGIGIIIFGWAQAAGDFDEIGMAPLFVVASVGLALVLAAGYAFLGARGEPATERQT